MSDYDRREIKDRRLVPADAIQRYHIVRDGVRFPPVAGIFDEPLRCYKVNEEWAKHIMGAVAVLSFWTAWEGSQDDRNLAVQEIMDFMIGEVCGMFLLRQNPTNNCLLEQSVDGGDNWTPAFNFSLCIGGGSDAALIVYIDIAITNIENLNIAYIDAGLDITIMYPNVEYDASGQDADRDTALCYAIQAMTEGIYNAAEAVINQQINRNQFLSQIISALTGGFWASDGTLIAALSQSIVDSLFNSSELQAASDALANTQARRDVVCCIYGNMEGNTATFALWNTAGDGCGFAPGSDAALLLDVLTPIFAGLDAYLSWVTLLSDGVDLAIAGVMGNDCLTCEDWLAVIDFSASDGGFVQDFTPLAQFAGVWVSGQGWQAEVVDSTNPAFDQNACVIELDFTGGTYTLLGMTLNFDYHRGSWTGTSQLAQRLTREATNTDVSRNGTVSGDGQVLSTPTNPITGSTRVGLFLRSSLKLKTGGTHGSALMTSVEIAGTGSIPPELAAYIV